MIAISLCSDLDPLTSLRENPMIVLNITGFVSGWDEP